MEGVPLLEKSSCLTTIAEADSSAKSPGLVAILNMKPTSKESVKSCETTVTSSKAEIRIDESMESMSILRHLSTFDKREDEFRECSEIIDKSPAHLPPPTVFTNDPEKPAQTAKFSQLRGRENNLQSPDPAVCNPADVEESELRSSLNVDKPKERLAADKQIQMAFEESVTQVSKKADECREKEISNDKTLERSAVVCMCENKDQNDNRFYSESELLVKEKDEDISIGTSKPWELRVSSSLQVDNEDNSYSYKETKGVNVAAPQEQRIDSNISGCLQSASETVVVEGNLGRSVSLFDEPLENSKSLQCAGTDGEKSSLQKEVNSFDEDIKISATNEKIPSLRLNNVSEEESKRDTAYAMPKDRSQSIIDDSDLCERVKRRRRSNIQVMQPDEGQISSSENLLNLRKLKKKRSLGGVVSSQKDKFSNPQQKNARNLFKTLDKSTKTVEDKSQDNKSRSFQQNQDLNGATVNKDRDNFRGRETAFTIASSISSTQSVEEIVPASIPSLEDSGALVIDPMIPHRFGSCNRFVTTRCLSQPIKNTTGETLNNLDKLFCSDDRVAGIQDSQLTQSEKETIKTETRKNLSSSDSYQPIEERGTFVEEDDPSNSQTKPTKLSQIEGNANRFERTNDLCNNAISPQNTTQDTEDDDQTLDSHTLSDTPVHCTKEDPATPCLFGDDVSLTSPDRTCTQKYTRKLSLRTKRNKLTRNRNSKFCRYTLESCGDDENSLPTYPSGSSAECKSSDSHEENSTSQSISMLQDLDYTVLEQEFAHQQYRKNTMGDGSVENSDITTASDEEPSPKRLRRNRKSNTQLEQEGNLQTAGDDDSGVKSETTQYAVEGFKTPRTVRAQIQVKSQSSSTDEREDYHNIENKVVKENTSQDHITSDDFRLLRLPSQNVDGVDGSFSQDDIIPPTPPVKQHGVNTTPQLASHKVISTHIYRETNSPVGAVRGLKEAAIAMQKRTDLCGLIKRRNHQEESPEPKQKRACITKENACKVEDTLNNLQELKAGIGTTSSDAEHYCAAEMNAVHQHDSVEAGQDEGWQDSPTDELLLEPAFVQNEKAENSFKEIHQTDGDLNRDCDRQEEEQDLQEYNAVSGDIASTEVPDVGRDEDLCNSNCKFKQKLLIKLWSYLFCQCQPIDYSDIMSVYKVVIITISHAFKKSFTFGFSPIYLLFCFCPYELYESFTHFTNTCQVFLLRVGTHEGESNLEVES